ncbi:regulator of chromosome condensation (RCC1) and BTB (POZ) domain containing protein [Sarcoptes scabiei]|uniref:Regulator of chromosome condensation (RCC1) and BTB (POZ) domain containing protein n=1 Tax=Sarcoptes scabiei TaxID=52283 RepID=A0A132ADJ9_SARSC|nr:regulator of chromosome condensation (RCC1) and BTB (POZ) domain containing protein [Sarcoptes scabiei]
MALTEIGDLYGWGANHSGQLGIGWFRTCSLEPTLILHDVRKVCCGPKHTVALIFDGSIRMWGKFPGHNQNYTPDRLIRAPGSMLDLISTKFLTIAFNNCFDDDDRGAFYAWGDLKHFGLSESSTVRLTYKRCDYNKISKIVSIGSNKFLVLTNDGRVSIISIQNERVRSIKNPFKMIKSVDFCTDVPEDPNMAVLMDQNGECFVWDDRKPVGENLQQTNLSSIADVACLYSSAFTPHITKLPSELIQNDFEETRPSNKLPTILRFNDPTFSDLIFKFSHYHQKPIYVHKIILSDHSEHFSLLLRSKPIVENKSSVILIEDNSYISMFYYLRHIYTKQVEFEKFDRLLLMEIYDISIKYFDQLLSDKIVDHLYSLERIDQTATMTKY